MLLGSHLSIAGGLDRAPEAAGRYGFSTVALFVRNPRQWRVPPLGDEAVPRFIRARREAGVRSVVAHASYLLNLSAAAKVRGLSIRALAGELARCGRLGIEFLVLHPGSHPDEREGVELVAAGVDEAVALADEALAARTDRAGVGAVRPGEEDPSAAPTLLLETTAGQGSSIGCRFEHLAGILARLGDEARVGICLNTCHVFAAGYDIRTPAAYHRTMEELDRLVGLDRVRAVHLNDSVGRLGVRVDRHAHIGFGRIGRAGFANIVRDPRLTDVPLILETPKGTDARGRDWDRHNADTLLALARGR